jgi:hypothetical protein
MLSDNIEITLSLNRARDFFICLPNEVGSFTRNESAIVSRRGMFLSAVGLSGGWPSVRCAGEIGRGGRR